jgi:rhamnosyltransferase
MVVGRQIPWEDTKPPEKFFYYYNFPDFRITVQSNAVDYYHDNVFISNVNSAIRKDVWQRYRFSESIVMAEDKEIAIRLLSDRLNILYQPEAIVYHAHDYSIKDLYERSIDYGLSLRQGVGFLPKSKGTNFLRIKNLFSTEFKFMVKNRTLKWLPYVLLYNASMYLGIFLGKAGLCKRALGSVPKHQ